VDEAASDLVRKALPDAPPAGVPARFVVTPISMGEPLVDLTCTARAIEMLDELERNDRR
jgi:hypothetical protein